MTIRRLAILGALLLAVAPVSSAFAEYVSWDPGGGNAVSLATPHKDYQTTTVKCAVCHSVHNASVSAEPTMSAPTELLLRSSVADACTYCHIVTSIGGIVIYDGNADNYNIDNIYGHNRDAGATCVGCHSVHGSNTMDGIESPYILRKGGYQQSFVDFIAGGDASIIDTLTTDVFMFGVDRWRADVIQRTAFCSKCHPFFTQASEDTITATMTKGHPLKAKYSPWDVTSESANGFVAQGATVPTDQPVAAYGSKGCDWFCHEARWFGAGAGTGPGLKTESYPHYTPSFARFLTAQSMAGGVDPPVGATNPAQDSVCTRCHRWSDTWYPVAGGVGVSY